MPASALAAPPRPGRQRRHVGGASAGCAGVEPAWLVVGQTAFWSGGLSSAPRVPSCGTGPLSCVQHLQRRAARPARGRGGSGRARPAWRRPRRRRGWPTRPRRGSPLLARRVVGQLVEQVVDDLERRRQVGRRRRARSLGRRPQDLDHRQRGAGERPQLVLDDRRRLAQERPRLHAAPGRGRGRRAAARRASGPSTLASASALRQRGVRRVAARRGSSLQRRAQVRRPGRRTPEDARWRSRPARPARRPCRPAPGRAAWKLWIERRMLRWRSASAPLSLARSRAVGSKRLSVGRQRLALAVEPLARAADQQLQVVARVGVERGEDLVEVDVRQRLGDRDRAARRAPRPPPACPGRAR